MSVNVLYSVLQSFEQYLVSQSLLLSLLVLFFVFCSWIIVRTSRIPIRTARTVVRIIRTTVGATRTTARTTRTTVRNHRATVRTTRALVETIRTIVQEFRTLMQTPLIVEQKKHFTPLYIYPNLNINNQILSK